MIVAGFGFSTRASLDSLRSAYERARAGRTAQALATADDKAPALRPLAQHLGLPVHGIAPGTLAAQTTDTRAPRVLAERGTGSVAEAAALAAAGPGARLLGPRIHSTDRLASCALAEGKSS